MKKKREAEKTKESNGMATAARILAGLTGEYK